jgi:peptidoglycan-N-acetylglucosamine deacetylase
MSKLFLIMCLSMVTLSGFAGILKKKIPDKVVVLTFDDATASQYSVVAPMLKEFGFCATFFICEFPPNFADTSKYMNWRQIKVLDKMGFEIANHTRSHPKITRLSDSEFDRELGYIDKKCDSLRISKPGSFAYPGYDLNLKVLQSLQQKGFLFARAGGGRPYDPKIDHPLLIPSWAMNANNRQLMMDAFQQAKNGKIVVLTIHGVPDSEHPWVNTPPELFREYLQYLSLNGYKVLSLRDLKRYINVKKALMEITPDFNKILKN